MNIDEWLRHFRRAKTRQTLDIMARRKVAKHQEQVDAITQAWRHRESELNAGRLLDTATCSG